jgi:hypothetical protein
MKGRLLGIRDIFTPLVAEVAVSLSAACDPGVQRNAQVRAASPAAACSARPLASRRAACIRPPGAQTAPAAMRPARFPRHPDAQPSGPRWVT